MSPPLFYLYLATWTLVALTPGPAVVCSMSQGSRFGFRASLSGIAGIQMGNLFFFGCVALGLGTLLAAATVAFEFIRIIGALYLVYLGVRAIVSSFRRLPGESGSSQTSAPPRRNLMLQGLLIQLTNPKALLFVSALLPQFIEPTRAIPLQLGILVVTTIVVDTVILSTYAFLARRGADSIRSSQLSSWLDRAFGSAMIFFGLRLLIARR